MLLLLLASTSFAERFPDLEDCVIQAPAGLQSARARCGTLEVPENPAKPDGRRIELALAVLPAQAATPAPDPVFYLAGGPGQSARDLLPLQRIALQDVRRQRDLVFLDQRGTGASHPLHCDFSAMDPFLESEPEAVQRLFRECLDALDADPRFYTSAQAADDLDRLREHLGYERINLVGSSYGTRLAQVYLRLHPQRTRSAVLDGVVPTRLVLGSEHGRSLDEALGAVIAACSEEPACAERFPQLPDHLDILKARYPPDAGPQRLELIHPRSGHRQPVDFGHDGLAQTLRMLSYSAQTQALLPLLIHEAATEDAPERLATQLMMIFEQLDDMIAVALETSIGCSEDWPAWQALPEAELARERDTLLGDSMHAMREEICEFWPAGEVAADFHEPFASDVPILLLSGELDPVTPPRYGEEAAAQFENARHLLARGQGHGVLMPPCISSIAAEFIETTDPEGLDTACLDRLGPSPFFLDLLGPDP